MNGTPATDVPPAADPSPLILFGRPTPWRGIWGSVIMAAALIIGVGTFGLLGSHPELTPMVLMFLLLPAIAIPLLIAVNRYAVVDRRTWLVSVNGGQPRPLADLRYCRFGTFRGVSTIELGYSNLRKDRFIVSSHSPFASPRIERDWVRYLLPYTGLPRSADGSLGATLEQAQRFAHEDLK